MNFIKNCLITHSDAKVLREYCVDKSNPLYSKYRGFNTSLNLQASEVYALYSGYIVLISGDSKHSYEVVVQLNNSQAIRYCNLSSTAVKLHDPVDIGQHIGSCKNYVAVEYLSTLVNNTFPFRIGSTTFYKDDPARIIDPSSSAIQNTNPLYSSSGLIDIEYSFDGGVNPEMIFMLSDNRGAN